MASNCAMGIPISSDAVTKHGVSICVTGQHEFKAAAKIAVSHLCKQISCSKSLPFQGGRSQCAGQVSNVHGMSMGHIVGVRRRPCSKRGLVKAVG